MVDGFGRVRRSTFTGGAIMERGPIQSALASAHGRNGKRRVETCKAGRAGVHRPSEALHPTRSSDVLTRIARERVPTAETANAPNAKRRTPNAERQTPTRAVQRL